MLRYYILSTQTCTFNNYQDVINLKKKTKLLKNILPTPNNTIRAY